MGIRGLTTFINNHLQDFYKPHKLKDTVLIVDGDCVKGHLTAEACANNYLYCGDYYQLYENFIQFFETLKKCNVTPIVLIDGLYEASKQGTKVQRFLSHIADEAKVGEKLSSGLFPEQDIIIRPYNCMENFLDALKDCGVPVVRCDLECDDEVAALGKAFNCPVLSQDSDFFIYDVNYIPLQFISFEHVSQGYVDCKMFDRRRFTAVYELWPGALPLLACLSGNDYVSRDDLRSFYLKISGRPYAPFDYLLKFLKSHRLNSVMAVLKECFGSEKILETIRNTIERYQTPYTSVFAALKKFPQIESLMKKAGVAENNVRIEDKIGNYRLTSTLVDLHRDCVLMSSVLGMGVLDLHVMRGGLEDVSAPSTTRLCLPILRALYTMVLRHRDQKPPYPMLLRTGTRSVREAITVLPDLRVGNERLTGPQRREIYFRVLGLTDHDCEQLRLLPKEWLIFFITVVYWMRASRQQQLEVPHTHLRSFVLNLIAMQVVLKKVGYFQSASDLEKCYPRMSESRVKELKESSSLVDMVGTITNSECVVAAKKLLRLKVPVGTREEVPPNIRVIHHVTGFFRCLKWVTAFGCVMGCPFPRVRMSEFYCGTLFFGLHHSLQSSTPVSSLLGQSTKLYHIHQATLDILTSMISTT